MDDFDIEEYDDWHKDLNSWENHQDELELIASNLSQEEYWNPVPEIGCRNGKIGIRIRITFNFWRRSKKFHITIHNNLSATCY